ncbi:uncharacterized protein LOC123520810 isoform X2 [Portunus trituberculatus]|uniref:uncharacterized protein LOC123520810 isoform X2 n=1 Tax=Portunus trituberculatus TaxID=210409 RepID=UPI001E1CC577|nr:uncharacterized protein LOC123520810 isoform X2 [Portunus trituberculatus]
MSSLHLLSLLVVWITVVVGDPLRAERIRRGVGSQFPASGRSLLTEASVGHVLVAAPRDSRLINVQPNIPALEYRLPDNYTLIIANPVDNFRCNDRPYGYYADVENDCKIFHVCLPLQQLYPLNFTAPITYQFSFICNFETQFSQDSMTCAWRDEALPCELSPELYSLNMNFGRKVLTDDGKGERYAKVNEPLP